MLHNNMKENQFIHFCRDLVLSGKKISDEQASRLMNISSNELQSLCNAAHMITKKIIGPKIDIEQLSNIKKNYCSEDCSFCSQSAFFNTNIDRYQLPPPEKIVNAAKKALDEGANSYCLVAAWREPTHNDCNWLDETFINPDACSSEIFLPDKTKSLQKWIN